MDDDRFRFLLNKLGYSWAGYRRVRKGVKKRLIRHMQALGCREVEAYLSDLYENPEHMVEARIALTVPSSRFFRDRALWQGLFETVLRPLAEVRGQTPLRAWSAGCGRGEEVYSLRLVWEMGREWLGAEARLLILATDLNPENLKQARQGVYPAGSLREVSAELRALFMKCPGVDLYEIPSFIRQDLLWARHDLRTGPAGRAFDLIFLRNNLLTYETLHHQETVLIGLVKALTPGGFLVVGARETLPRAVSDLSPRPELPGVWQKINAPTL